MDLPLLALPPSPRSILSPPPPSTRSPRPAPPPNLHSAHRAVLSKILASSGNTSSSLADSILSDFDQAAQLPRPCARASCDYSAANDILWDHFGFIPPHPDLVLDGYKAPSPLPSPTLAPRTPSANPPLSRTSPSILPPPLPNMPKKRRSLQAILVPSFLPQASTSASALSVPPSRARSHTVTSSRDLSNVECSPDWLSFYSGQASPRPSLSSIVPITPSRNSPPPDLLDEDPFANRSPAPSLRSSRATSPVLSAIDVFGDGLQPPRSPLAQSAALPEDGSRLLRHASSFSSFQDLSGTPSTPPPTPIEPLRPLLRRPKSSGPTQVRPAYTRPAFAPRPSLPSLNTLTRTSVLVPKVRRGRPGAHLPLEPWEDSAPSAPSEPPSPTWSVHNSPIARRRGHSRRPTLSMIRDSRMYLDGENAEDGGIPPLEPEEKEPSSACTTPTPIPQPPRDREDIGIGTSFLSISPEDYRGSFEDDQDKPPTPPPKSPNFGRHLRSASQTSATSTCTVPSLCPSSPTSTSWESVEPTLRSQSSTDSHAQIATSPSHPSHFPPSPPHPHVHIDTEHSGPPSYPAVFAHQRHTQFLTNDLLASLEYDYSEALTSLSTAAASGLAVPLAPSALFPSGDFEPGSSAGTIRNLTQARALPNRSDDHPAEPHEQRMSDASQGSSKWSNEATDAHPFLGAPLSPMSPPELPSSSSEPSAESSPARSPCATLSRSSSSSAVSSEYDFGDDEFDGQYGYSYDVGAFADPLGSPPAHRPVFGYGIPWPSTHRTSAVSGGSGGSGSGGSMSDVLSDLEDLAEDLTERFSLSMRSADEQSVYGDGSVFSDDGSLADTPEGDAGSRRSGRPSGGATSSQSHSHSTHGTSNGYGYPRSSFRRGSAGAGGDEDGEDDDDGRKRRPTRLTVSAPAAVTDSETSESESESDYGEASPRARPHHRERHDTTRPGMHAPATAPIPVSTSPADDDVPLARQIPTALKAQRTIRRQVRDELDQKRQERRAQRAQQALLAQQQQQQQQPASAMEPAFPAHAQASATAPATGSSPPRAAGRPRTKTLPSTMGSPFSVGDLTKKLLGLQTASSTNAPAVPPTPVSPMYPQSKRPSLEAREHQAGSASAGPSLRGRTNTIDPHTYGSASRGASRPPAPEAPRGLRPMRSFHRQRAGDADALLSMPPMPLPERTSQSEQPLHRRATTTSRHRPDEPPAFLATAPPAPVPVPSSGLDRARSMRSAKSSSSRRPSVEKRPEQESVSAGSGSRPRGTSASASASANATPASTFSQPGKAAGQMMWQQRVFIGNMQRFVQVEIGSGTGAGDVLAMVDAQGALEPGAGSGGWMLWEVSQDFGMERPIRSFELLSDVCGSWNTDKTVNLLVIKKTLLAPLLNPKAMPSASPTCSGYVQFEYKRGKWQKRWMELREHSLWLSKRDTGKDATFLCSLNNFDAYYVTRVHKAPKPYVFSVKSTDSLSFFENTADYVHVFSCGEGEGKNWLEKILLARSYVLYQDRNVLSTTTATAPGISAGAPAGGLQRAGTRRQPAQPLVNVGAPKADPMRVPAGFEPAAGSLLARRHQ